MPSKQHRQIKRWATIQANARPLVKTSIPDLVPDIRAHLAFPILAVAPSARHVGIVCLDGRLRAIVARSCRVRDYETDQAKIAAARAVFASELALRFPATVVIESGLGPGHAPVAAAIAACLAETARESGCRVVRRSFRDACARVTSTASAEDAATVLVRRYEPLAERLAPNGVPLLRSERFREARPLLAAFALAHAFGLDVLVAVIRPLGCGPPPNTHHDHHNSRTA